MEAFQRFNGFALGLLLVAFAVGNGEKAFAEIHASGKNGLRTEVNGLRGGRCSESVCRIGGGSIVGRNTFHRFKKFDTRGAIQRVEFETGGQRNIVVGVTSAKGTWLDKAMTFSSKANLYWLSPGGIYLGEAANFINIPRLSLSTADQLHFAEGAFDAFRSKPSNLRDFTTNPLPGVFGMRRSEVKEPVRLTTGQLPGIHLNGINISLDKELLVVGDRVTSFWENSEMQASGKISEKELAILSPIKNYLPKSVFDDTVFIPPISKPDKVDRKNRRKATKLLKEAGWDLVDGKLKNKNGDKFSLEILNYSPAFDRIINPFIENLKLLGIDAKHTRIDGTQYTERVRNFEWEIITSTYGNSLTPGLELIQQYSSKTADVPSRNLVGLKNEGIDKLIELAAKAKTRDDLNVIIRSLDRSLRSLHIWVPQWYKNVHTIAYRNQYAYPNNLPPFELGAFDFWWFDAKKAAILENK